MSSAEYSDLNRLRSSTEIRHDALYGDEEEFGHELDKDELNEMDEEALHSSPLSPRDKTPQGRAASDAALAAMGVSRKSPSPDQSGAAEVEMSSLLREGESGGSGVEEYPGSDLRGAQQHGGGGQLVPGGQVDIWSWGQVGYLSQYFAVGLIYGGLLFPRDLLTLYYIIFGVTSIKHLSPTLQTPRKASLPPSTASSWAT